MTDKKARALIARLNTGDGMQQYQTMQALLKIGSPAVPALIETLADENLRDDALSLLPQIADPRVVPALIRVLRNEGKDWSVAESRHWGFRRKAATVLGEIGDRQALPVLMQVLRNPHVFADPEAAEALGAIGDRQAVPVLIEALRDRGRKLFVGEKAAQALGRIGDIRAIPALIEALREEDVFLSTREEAIRALVAIGKDPQTVPALIQALRDQDNFLSVRREAVEALEALAVIGDPQAAPALIGVLGEEDLQAKAVRALVKLDFPDFLALRDALNRDALQNETGAFVIAALLGVFRDEDEDWSERPLLPVRRTDPWSVRLGTAKALGVVAGCRPDPALRAALPILRRFRRRHPIYEEALTQIETVTILLKNLPLPAAAPPPDARALPRPAENTPLDAPASPPPGLWARLHGRRRGAQDDR